jgi:hypothetical protein
MFTTDCHSSLSQSGKDRPYSPILCLPIFITEHIHVSVNGPREPYLLDEPRMYMYQIKNGFWDRVQYNSKTGDNK